MFYCNINYGFNLKSCKQCENLKPKMEYFSKSLNLDAENSIIFWDNKCRNSFFLVTSGNHRNIPYLESPVPASTISHPTVPQHAYFSSQAGTLSSLCHLLDLGGLQKNEIALRSDSKLWVKGITSFTAECWEEKIILLV